MDDLDLMRYSVLGELHHEVCTNPLSGNDGGNKANADFTRFVIEIQKAPNPIFYYGYP